ncbi:GDP-L-fucose synthase family protein [Desulforhopalus singaporensis]|uniref:GDP-L-fucose synthase n=1 Tax=Desulforhopalus singaporensis TaxID=91360 RepID=A0A1H0U8S6_9BACT|nr:GDP-L-fucose synthase [Desulforhopalus singaporensis]SDP62702.1 GDP-L-fucose synthase [Desulforhopalus singaporensis]
MIGPDERIFVAGHRGMVGAAVVRQLRRQGCRNIITRSHDELDLVDQGRVKDFFKGEKIDRVILAAARVGGIHANNRYPAEFIYTNLMIQSNVIHQAFKCGVEKLLFLGSSCIYPKYSPQPMKESHLLTGTLEPTNEPYAIAKIAGIKMCESYNRQYGTCYRSVMPTNLYGPGDNYHLENSHVIPAMVRKYHLAKLAMDGNVAAIEADQARYGKIPEDISRAIGYRQDLKKLSDDKRCEVVLWGSGTPRREFLHVDDMAGACVHVMSLDQSLFVGANPSFVNVGAGKDIPISQIAQIIAELVGYKGITRFNSDQPDGTPRKLLDITRLSQLGWKPAYSLKEGLENAYEAYLSGTDSR